MNWRDIGPTTFEAWTTEIQIRAPKSPILLEGRFVYDAVGEHSRLCLGMMWMEDRYQTDPSDRFPISYHNCMNMKTPDSKGWMQFASYTEAVAAWRERITSKTYKPQAPGIYAATETIEELVHVYAPSFDNNNEKSYVNTIKLIVAELKAIEKRQGENPVYTTSIPGLPGGPLVTTYPIRMNMIAIDGYQRTGQKAKQPRRSVQHGTGNPGNASAMAEAQYFVNGAEGRQASIHACSDDKEVVICVPLDEVTWQAADGSGPGNMNGFSCEMMEAVVIWTNVTRRDNLIAITADFMGRVAALLGATKTERHWDFNYNLPPEQRHHCPDKLMDTGHWQTSYVPKWNAARVNELQRMNGGTTTTTTTAPPVVYPPKPVKAPDELKAQGYDLVKNDPKRFTAIQGGLKKTGPSLDAPNASKVPYKANRPYIFDFSTKEKIDGEIWLVSNFGSWAPAKNFKVLEKG